LPCTAAISQRTVMGQRTMRRISDCFIRDTEVCPVIAAFRRWLETTAINETAELR
jgi:hypothetical protein